MKSSPGPELRSKRGWAALFIVLSIEAFGGLALLAQAGLGMLQATGEPLGQRLSIVLGLVIAWAWVLVTLFAGLKTRASWARGSALTIHVLIFAAGTGMLQFGIGTPLLGWMVVVLAFVGFFAAILARPTVASVEGDEGDDEIAAH